jgi:methylglyoxal reductase
MVFREVGKSGMMASVISLGTWAAGGDSAWGDPDDALAIRTMEEGIAKGINLIDTAPAYGFGHSEELVGRAVKGKRSEVLISTKCGLGWDTEEGSFLLSRDGKNVMRNLSKKAVKQGAEDSLRRLCTDYIDIFITHWQSVEPLKTPISETMEALLELKAEGKIRAIGISNVTVAEVEEYLRYGRVDVIQQRYSMITNGAEKNILPICNKYNITFQTYMPLEQGLLAGKITPDTVLDAQDIRNRNPWYKNENLAPVLRMLEKWKPLCEKYGCTYSQLSLAWTIAHSPRFNVLCGSRKPQHIEENVVAAGLVLEAADIADMNCDLGQLPKVI